MSTPLSHFSAVSCTGVHRAQLRCVPGHRRACRRGAAGPTAAESDLQERRGRRPNRRFGPRQEPGSGAGPDRCRLHRPRRWQTEASCCRQRGGPALSPAAAAGIGSPGLDERDRAGHRHEPDGSGAPVRDRPRRCVGAARSADRRVRQRDRSRGRGPADTLGSCGGRLHLECRLGAGVHIRPAASPCGD